MALSLKQKLFFESLKLPKLFNENTVLLDSPLVQEQIKTMVLSAHKNKATCTDMLPRELMQNIVPFCFRTFSWLKVGHKHHDPPLYIKESTILIPKSGKPLDKVDSCKLKV